MEDLGGLVAPGCMARTGSDVARTWLGRGSDWLGLARTWLGRGSDVARTGSEVPRTSLGQLTLTLVFGVGAGPDLASNGKFSLEASRICDFKQIQLNQTRLAEHPTLEGLGHSSERFVKISSLGKVGV